jgi:aminoglycoside phosphotransferase (APT) family kinase protein
MLGDVSTSQLGTISSRAMQCVFDQHQLGQVTHMQPAAGGSFRQVLEIASSSGHWIFKGAPLRPWQFYAEYFYTSLLHEKTALPVPWPYIHDTSCSVFDWDFALMPRLGGVELGDPAVWRGLALDEQHDLAVDMGKALASVAVVTAAEAGTYDFPARDIRPFAQGFASGLGTELGELIHQIREISPESIPERDVAWIEDGIADLLRHTTADSDPRLTMQDFKDQNMVGRSTENGWRISGLFDLGGLHFGDPAMGFCRQIAQFQTYEHGDDLARTFVGSAINHGMDASHLAQRVTGFAIHERLASWDWAKREGRDGIIGAASTFREWSEPVVRLALNSVSVQEA